MTTPKFKVGDEVLFTDKGFVSIYGCRGIINRILPYGDIEWLVLEGNEKGYGCKGDVWTSNEYQLSKFSKLAKVLQ